MNTKSYSPEFTLFMQSVVIIGSFLALITGLSFLSHAVSEQTAAAPAPIEMQR
jgi:hypothetical protein